ncbi:SDR family NAD(P)-dependent oxidoreductase [Actinomadura citrea]|uniref:SDR family NAD(P)-dependent oxidoreductase n=1 Tax=Actinomadura citrea TaxID=46158 RepID=UPI003CE469A1
MQVQEGRSQRALVIGGLGAIGGAVVRRLRDAGWECLVASRSPSADISLDVGDEASVVAASAASPPLDALVIATNLEPSASLSELTGGHAAAMFATHVTGPLLFIRSARHLLAKGSSIVFLSSPAAYRGSYDPCYAAAKGATIALARTLAKELAPDVRVNVLSPSIVEDSPVARKMTPDFRARHREASLLERTLSMEECAEAVCFLVSHPHVTGATLHLNGGEFLGA